MRIIGIDRPETGGIDVAALSQKGDSVTVVVKATEVMLARAAD